MKHIIVIVFIIKVCFSSTLYDILGVPKDATTQEIKKAYKKAARVWHPDKNRDPEANEKFMKINEAYETLSDDKKRNEYDTFGKTSSDNTPNQHGHPFGGFDSFQTFFSNFRGNTRDEEHSPAFNTVSYRQFKLELIPDSEKQPYLIYGYGDFCFPCMRMNGVWRRSGEELIPLGIGMRVFNVEYDGHLRDELRIHYVPTIAAVIDGQVRYFRGGEISPATLRHFLRDVFPYGLYQEITDDNWYQFSRAWTDNKARFIMISPSRLTIPPLRFYISAFRYRENMAAGWTTPKLAPKLMKKFGVSTPVGEDRETLLVFHEDDENPVASLSSHSLKSEVMWEVLNENRLLDLPRLSSPAMLERMCPPEMRPHRKHLCVLLVSERGYERSPEMNSFREFARKFPRSEFGNRVRLGYIYERVQIAFINGLNPPRDNAMNHIVIIWRKTSRQLAYRWLRLPWNASDRGTSKAILEETLHSALYGTGVLADEVKLSQLYDEHGASLLVRMWRRFLIWTKYFVDFCYSFDPSVVLTTVFVGAVTIMMCLSMWVAAKKEEAAYRKNNPSRQRRAPQPHETAGRRPDNRPILTELRVKTYGELITGSQQGQLTFVLLLSDETKEKLLTDYVQCILPYIRMAKILFSFTLLETHATWFKQLLSYTVDMSGRSRSETINVKNCAGTVLAFNGFRKYFCIYHPKIKSSAPRKHKRRGDFLGFDDSSSESYSSEDEEKASGPVSRSDTLQDPQSKLFQRDLLYGLPNWLDRVFDGAVPRIRVEYWPSMPMNEELTTHVSNN